MTTSIRIAAPLLWALACACSGLSPVEPRVSASLGEPFVLRVDQEAELAGDPARLRFEDVPEDSRCPSDVVCVWAGNARVRLRLSAGSAGSGALELNTGVPPASASLLGYRVELLGLAPHPASGRAVARDRYLAEIRVTREP